MQSVSIASPHINIVIIQTAHPNWHIIPIKLISFPSNITKCGKVQMEWKFMQATVLNHNEKKRETTLNKKRKKYITKCIFSSVNVHIFKFISREHFTITLSKNGNILWLFYVNGNHVKKIYTTLNNVLKITKKGQLAKFFFLVELKKVNKDLQTFYFIWFHIWKITSCDWNDCCCEKHILCRE